MRRERGATAVVVALLMVVMFSFAAVAVDVGALWWDRKEHQNGADAGALAIAQACAAGACGTTSTDAQALAEGNKRDRNVQSLVSFPAANEVKVDTWSVRQLWFGGVVGMAGEHEPCSPGPLPAGEACVSATATARWGSPAKATVMPFAISNCWFQYQTGYTYGDPPPVGTTFAIPVKSKTGSIADGGTICGSLGAHNETAGGFGWLDASDATGCSATIDLANPWVGADPGMSPPSCIIGRIQPGDSVIMPIYDAWRGSGNNAEYRIAGFAGFKVTSYCFGSGAAAPGSWASCKDAVTPKEANIVGTFVEMVSLADGLKRLSTDPAQNFGGKIVVLVD